jgi:hypothetical protein
MHQFMILLYYFLSRMLYLLHFDLVQLEQMSHLPSSAPPTTNGGTVLRRFRVDSRKKDSGMPNGQNVNYLVMIGAVLVIGLVAVAVVTLFAKMTLI